MSNAGWLIYMCVCVIVGQVSTVKWHFNTVNNNKKVRAHTHTPTDSLAVCSNTEHCSEERISCYYGWKDLHCICTAGIFQTKSLQIKEPQQPQAFKDLLLKSLSTTVYTTHRLNKACAHAIHASLNNGNHTLLYY